MKRVIKEPNPRGGRFKEGDLMNFYEPEASNSDLEPVASHSSTFSNNIQQNTIMFQRGRGEQPIKYKAEVLKRFPNAEWYKRQGVGGAIRANNKRISEVYNVAWKAWEDAYYKLLNKDQNDEPSVATEAK